MAFIVATAILVGAPGTPRAGAAANGWPHTAMGGFSTPAGDGFWVTYADGTVAVAGAAKRFGDASGLPLKAPILGGAPTPSGNGYWLVGWDGGVFTFGGAHFWGSTGGKRLNQPIFGMTPTRTGRGYWLVARDGGIFAFGDATFHGSMGGHRLAAPIVGISTSPSGRGYRMVGQDGGIFSFGDVPYYGSLPGIGVHVNDVVAMAPTPTNRGYWIVRRQGQVYRFGDAQGFGSYTSSPCDRVRGIFANPAAQGYRLVTDSGATIPYGTAPGGDRIGGRQRMCFSQTTCVPHLDDAPSFQTALNTRGPIWTGADGATTVGLGDGRRLWLFGDTYSGPTDGTHVLPGYLFLRNSVAVESNNCMEFRVGGDETRIGDYFWDPAPTEWFWPLNGVVDKQAGVVLVSAMHNAYDGTQPHGFRWKQLYNEIMVLDLKSLLWRGSYRLPTYGGLFWGSTMLTSGGLVYIYAVGSGSRQYAARTAINHLQDGAGWQFWNGTTWSTNPNSMAPMKFITYGGANDPGPLGGIQIDPYGAGFLASTKRCDIFCPDLTAWFSPSLAGPWRAVNTNNGKVANTYVARGLIAYAGHLLSTRTGFIGVWSVNRESDSMSTSVFGPRTGVLANLPSADELMALATGGAHAAVVEAPPPTRPSIPISQIPKPQAQTDFPTPAGWTNH
jgi:hypothetical protein